ncbi:NK-lysin tandem duplicate 4 [Thalassophryne amazonica]|uniref:NK-lysin tandem duplicate 4 n=1 Tax=Thalassophryne amazonica TaxID=390379 RepID=UPI0014715838|nr:NK-lysin tandem duplicate 4 [Thalassophryne amazonica]
MGCHALPTPHHHPLHVMCINVQRHSHSDILACCAIMETSPVLLVWILITCSVWMVQSMRLEVDIDDHVDTEISVEASKLPGLCWACKWSLNKVKKLAGPNATAEVLKSKLLSICNQIGLLQPLCRSFVKKNLGELIEELTTTDDVRTICVNTKACMPKEMLQPPHYEDAQIHLCGKCCLHASNGNNN